MKTWCWDEIGCEWSDDMGPDSPGWKLKVKHGPVKEFRSDHNHLAIEVEAKDEKEAHALAMEHCEPYAEFNQEEDD